MTDYTDTQYDNDDYSAVYKGSKTFTQQQVLTANATGFGSAGDDHAERGIDLNERLIKNKPATFFFKMKGDAMQGFSIHNGDILIVDRSIKKVNEKIIVAVLNGEMLVRQLKKTTDAIYLLPNHPKHKAIAIDPCVQFMVWGVVTYVVHQV